MTTLTQDKPMTGSAALDTPWHVGTVMLTVRDRARVAAFYRDVIGLEPLYENNGETVLGAGEAPLLALREDKGARLRSPHEAGLFHTAFLLPRRTDLAAWLRHAIEKRIPIEGASDHLVSEAIYLSDPEGNGIEVYRDRLPSEWSWNGGRVRMATERLNIENLLAAAEAPFKGAPTGSVVGHIHLQVGDLQTAEAFYAQALGLDITAHYPGGTFYSSGHYHHHVATNIWHSRGAPVRDLPSTGLAGFELVARDASLVGDAAARLAAAGVAAHSSEGQVTLADPWRNEIILRTA